jgi:hypothetical protein
MTEVSRSTLRARNTDLSQAFAGQTVVSPAHVTGRISAEGCLALCQSVSSPILSGA